MSIDPKWREQFAEIAKAIQAEHHGTLTRIEYLPTMEYLNLEFEVGSTVDHFHFAKEEGE